MTEKQKTASNIISILKKTYPQADCTLTYESAWQLLVAAILSAQCTDARVNLITPSLFARFPTSESTAKADPEDISDLIRSCGLYRSKTRSIVGSAKMIQEQYKGTVPDKLEALTQLPGVGRKIANLILGDYHHIPALVVDTHCARISRRIGLTRKEDPAGIEKDLEKVIARDDWIAYGHLMVLHGRACCTARKPQCDLCPIADLCRYGKNHQDVRERPQA